MSTAKKTAKPSDLASSLDKNREATEEIKQIADDLALVHTVLDQTVPSGAPEDLGLATEQAVNLEKQLGEAADKLDKVNEQLTDEIEARKPNDPA
ncbi:hypothetical protein J7E70_26490 [Variovorax paradoxus]|nr:hypothetical protein [Variovorax paradoxus]MBT2303994.1 hypothetical protein [Variovorax paradoxus]